MATYLAQVAAPDPPDEVFAYLSDLTHFEEWDPGVKRSIHVSGDPSELGAAYDVTVGGIGGDLVLRYEIVELDRPWRVVAVARTGRLTSHDVIEVTRAGSGSLVTYKASLSLHGVWKLASPAMSLVFRRIGRRAEEGLERRLQRGVA